MIKAQIKEAQKLPEEETVRSPARVVHAPPRTSPAAVRHPTNTKPPKTQLEKRSVALTRGGHPWHVRTTLRAWRPKHRWWLRRRLHKRTANTAEQVVSQCLRRNIVDLA